MQEMDHDQACGLMFELLMELGCYDEEFVFWGFAYKDNEGRKYYVTTDGDKAYEFNQNCLYNGYAVTPVEKYFKWCKVAAGQRNAIKQKNKLEFALKLQEQYSDEFFAALELITNSKAANSALPIIQQLKELYRGSFDIDGLVLFQGLLSMAYKAKKIRLLDYLAYNKWSNLEISMCQKIKMPYNVKKKVVSGFVYVKKDGSRGYYCNAVPFMTYERKNEFFKQGIMTTPIFFKEYYCKNAKQMAEAQEDFKKCLGKRINDTYFAVIKKIVEADQENVTKVFAAVEKASSGFNQAEKNVLNYYKMEMMGIC